jgi:hypothetical protein
MQFVRAGARWRGRLYAAAKRRFNNGRALLRDIILERQAQQRYA